MNALLRTTAAALLTVFITTSLQGDDVDWQGANTQALDAYARINWYDQDGSAWVWKDGFDACVVEPFAVAANDVVDGYYLWSNSSVPGTGDVARFIWPDRHTYASVGGIVPVQSIITLDGDFSPGGIYHVAQTHYVPVKDFYVAKDLTLSSLYWKTGYTTGTKSALSVLDGYTLTLTGETPFEFEYHGPNRLILADTATLRFHAPKQSFVLPDGYLGYYGASAFSGSGTVEFTYPKAEITLIGAGNRTLKSGVYTDQIGGIAFPSLSVGAYKLVIRSDQTWLNPDRTGSLLFRAVQSNQPIFYSADGSRLDNLGNVPLAVFLGRDLVGQLPGGTYQSIRAWSGSTSKGVTRIDLLGDVTLAGGTVEQGDRDPEAGFEATESDYSLHLMGTQQITCVDLNMGGHALTTARGIMAVGGSTNVSQIAYDRSRIMAEGAILDIGGDLVLMSVTRPGGNLNDSGVLDETRNVGVWGDKDTVVTLRRSFITNVRSPGAGNGLHLSTVNLLGGSAEKPNTFEVGADPASDIAAGTYAIGTLNIGSATTAGQVRLVNDYINDGDAANTEKTGAGEVLLAGSLTIAADSLLDAGGQGVKVVTSLNIDTTAMLDLNHATALEVEDIVTNFVGIGDQVDQWNEFRASVTDSSNPGLGFKAVLDGGNTYWMATAGNATLLLIR